MQQYSVQFHNKQKPISQRAVNNLFMGIWMAQIGESHTGNIYIYYIYSKSNLSVYMQNIYKS